MHQTVYVKYNNSRQPDFAIKTSIIEDNGKKSVVKSSISSSGKSHILDFPKRYSALSKLYQNVNVLNVTIQDDSAVFPFITGPSAATVIEENLTDLHAAIKLMTEYLDNITDYSEDFITDFSPCKAYNAVFGETDYSGPALTVANADEILDNFIITDKGMTLIDYEWVFFFPVPVRYIKFRTVYYFLVKNYSIVTDSMSEEDFMKEFGFDTEETALWKKTDNNFQQYAHGKDRRYLYTNHYSKDIRDINSLLNNVDDIGKEFTYLVNDNHNVHAIIARQNELLIPKNYAAYHMNRIIKRLTKHIPFHSRKGTVRNQDNNNKNRSL